MGVFLAGTLGLKESKRKRKRERGSLFCEISGSNSKVDGPGIEGFGINTALISPNVIQ